MSTQIVKTQGNPRLAVAAPWPPVEASNANKDDSVLDVSGLFRVLSRRRRWIYGSALVFLALAALVCVVMTPRYKATAKVELLTEQQGALMSNAANGPTQPGGTQTEDALDFTLTLQTAVTSLESDELALRVIKELDLEKTPEFAYKPLFMSAAAKQQMGLPLADSPIRRSAILLRWSKDLKVESVAGTRVIEVSFSHQDPVMAAKIINQLLADYVGYRYDLRYAAALRSTDWLNSKLAAVKEQAEEASKRLALASTALGMYGNGDADHNLLVSRLEDLNSVASQAAAARASKEAIYHLASTVDPELVTGLVGGTSSASGGVTPNIPYLLIDLRQQEAQLNAEYAEGAGKYGPENQKLVQLKNKLDAARASVKAESDRIVGRARQEYLAAVAAETDANKALASEKRLAADLQAKTPNYNMAKNEAESAQSLYQRLLESSEETPIMAGIRSSDLNILDPATVPGKQSAPIVPLYLAIGAVLGTMVGVGLAFVRDSIDTTIRNPEDVEAMTQLPVLGIIPRSKTESGDRKRKKLGSAGGLGLKKPAGGQAATLDFLSAPQSAVMEAYRAVRSSILLSRPDNPRRVFMLTSANPGEGKSFSSLHLSAVLAQTGVSVLLVDCDLRRATLSRTLKMALRTGLTTLIAGTSGDDAYRQVPGVPGLTFVSSGAAPPNPAEIIGSRKMALLIADWRARFDFVVFDCPPILPVTDAAVLSQVVDGVLLVTRFAVSKQQAVIRAVHTLQGVNAECFGVIVNAMDVQSGEYDYSSEYGPTSEERMVEAELETVGAAYGEAK